MKIFKIIIIFSIILFIAYAGLHKEILKGDNEKAIKRIERGKEINRIDKKTGKTPLIFALEKQNHKIAKLLIEYGANVNVFGNDNSSTLMIAAKSQDLTLLSTLLKKGVDINYKNNNGKTALLSAVQNNNMKVVKFLIENNADITVIDDYNRNVVMYASQTGNSEMINMFLNTKVNITALDNSGKSVLDYANNTKSKALLQKHITKIAKPLINKANTHFNNKEYEKAIEEYNKAFSVLIIKEDKDKIKNKIAKCNYTLSKNHLDKNNFVKALELMNKAIEFGSSEAPTLLNVINQRKKMIENIQKMDSYEIVKVLEGDVFSFYYKETKQHDTELLKKVFKQSDDYKLLKTELQQLKEEILKTRFTIKIPSYNISDYSIKGKYFPVKLQANASPLKSKGRFYFPALPVRKFPLDGWLYDYNFEQGFIAKILLYVDEKNAIRIEENKSNYELQIFFDIIGMKKLKYDYFFGLSTEDNFVLTDNIELLVVDKKNATIWQKKYKNKK